MLSLSTVAGPKQSIQYSVYNDTTPNRACQTFVSFVQMGLNVQIVKIYVNHDLLWYFIITWYSKAYEDMDKRRSKAKTRSSLSIEPGLITDT